VLAKEIVVRCREEDKSFFKSGVKVGSTIQTLGGFIAENKEGTKEIDLTFEELLRNNEDEIKNTILEKSLLWAHHNTRLRLEDYSQLQ